MDKSDEKTGLIPGYAIRLMVVMLLINGVVYYGTRLITDRMTHYDISGSVDHMLPFLPVFILPYMLAYVQWGIGFVVIARQEKSYCYKILVGEMISEILVGIIFVAFPTTMLRADITGSDIFSKAVYLLYQTDAPVNLFPSIHCLESYIVTRAALEMKNTGIWYRLGMIVMSILVFMSTVLLKQHVIWDFFGAVAAAEAGRLLYESFFVKFFGKSKHIQ